MPLSVTQFRVLMALPAARNLEEAASAGPVAPGTLRRWMRSPEFVMEYRSLRAEIASQLAARLQEAALESLESLRDLMKDPKVPAGARVSAARAILQLGVAGFEKSCVVEQLAGLELTE